MSTFEIPTRIEQAGMEALLADNALRRMHETYNGSKELVSYEMPMQLFPTVSASPSIRYVNSDSIDKYFTSGGFVDAKGNARGSSDMLVEKAKDLQKDYMKFKNSKEGKALDDILGKDKQYDGFIYTKLGDNVLAANIATPDGKQYLAVNSQYSLTPEQKLMVFSHETVHRKEINEKGYSSEKSTDAKVSEVFEKLYQKAPESKLAQAYHRIYQASSQRSCYN